ncbi:hypothetical protein D3C87_190870 [compost metagenome]
MRILSLVLIYSLLAHSTKADVTLWGAEVQIGNGTARSYVELNESNFPISLGMALQGAALDGLPGETHQYDYLLPMPEMISFPPFKHLMINWIPHGHDPVSIYGAPHFDFHFYMISNEVRSAITCAGSDEAVCMKRPDTEAIPPFYLPTDAGIPLMGWHWYDPRSPEFNGQPFTATMIYGFYDGKMSFIEPMISRDFLVSRGSVDAVFPRAQKVPYEGYYPGRYQVSYDSVKDIFFVALKDFEQTP